MGTHNHCSGAKIRKKYHFFFILKIFIFYNFKNLCILHGLVFVMNTMSKEHSGLSTMASKDDGMI